MIEITGQLDLELIKTRYCVLILYIAFVLCIVLAPNRLSKYLLNWIELP